MDIKSYCDSVESELTGWKAKLYDIIRKSDSLPAGDKQKVGEMLEELHAIVDDLNDRLAYLDKECPVDWSSDEVAINDKITEMRGKWKEVYGVLGEAEYGLGGA